MKRVLLLLASLIVLLAACGGDKKEDGNQALAGETIPSNVSLDTALAGTTTVIVPQSSSGTVGVGSSGTPPVANTPAAGQTSSAAETPVPGSTRPLQPLPTQSSNNTPVGSAGVASVRATVGQVSNGTVEVVLSASGEGGVELGAWAVDITFDGARLAVDTCSAGNDGVCNPKFNETTARIVGIADQPKNGEIGRVRFKVSGSGATTVQVRPNQCLTPQAQPLTCNGTTVTIGQ